MTDQIAAFIDHMRAHDCGPENPDEIVADDKRNRYRLAGDRAKTQNASYQLKIEGDGFAVGWVHSFKQGVMHAWHSKSTRKATPEERAEWKRKATEAKKSRDVESKRIAEAAAAKSRRIWDGADKTGTTEYLDKKGTTLNGARISQGSVVLPLYAKSGIVGLQFITGDGAKRYLFGSTKLGSYFPIADRVEPMARILICEGYATACALRRCTGLPVVAAFDSGNLKPVAKVLLAKYPDTEFIIAADNDHENTKPDGTAWNPGIHHAQQAALAIHGCRVIAPATAAGVTDWDDHARASGDASVRAAFEALPDRYDDCEGQSGDYERVQDLPEEQHDAMRAIRPLGYDAGIYYFFPKTTGQIEKMSATDMQRIANLQKLAPYGFWMKHYNPDGKTATNKVAEFACSDLMNACHLLGIFQPESVRGIGAWIDNGEPIVNCGTSIVKMDKTSKHPAEFKGEYVYESGPNLYDIKCDPLSNAEAAKLLNICKSVTWKKSQFAYLLAGWLVVAPIGSAINWRPHIWVTGATQSGKSTVIQQIIRPLLGKVSINADQKSTEAGIRKKLGTSGRCVVLDEMEADTKRQQQSIEDMVLLVRLASSGGVIVNAYKDYNINSCFCFASIIARVENTQDLGRFSMLELMRDERPDRSDRFESLMSNIYETLTPEYSKAMLARTIANLPTLLKNIAVFSRAATDIFGNKRSGDQMGPMLAGAYMLTTTKEVSMEDAKAWISGQNWDWHTAAYDESDASKLLTYIMTARVRYDHAGMTREAAVGDLVSKASKLKDPHQEEADKALRQYGLRVKDGMLCIANQAPQLRKLLADTPYTIWARVLGDYPSAHNLENKPIYFMAGLSSKAIAIPVNDVLGRDIGEHDEEELPFGDDAPEDLV
jgi:putative DNA primase/helicase